LPRAYATLRFVGDRLNPDDISNILQVEPKRAQCGYRPCVMLPDTLVASTSCSYQLIIELVTLLFVKVTLAELLKEFVNVEFVEVTLKPPATAASSSSFSSTGSNTMFSIWFLS
jgi:hypothetical protein